MLSAYLGGLTQEVYSLGNPPPLYYNNINFNQTSTPNTQDSWIGFWSSEAFNVGGMTSANVLAMITSKLGSSNSTVWFPFHARGYSGSSAVKSIWFSGHIGISAYTTSWSDTQLNGVKCATADGTPTWYAGTYGGSGLLTPNSVGNYSTSILI